MALPARRVSAVAQRHHQPQCVTRPHIAPHATRGHRAIHQRAHCTRQPVGRVSVQLARAAAMPFWSRRTQRWRPAMCAMPRPDRTCWPVAPTIPPGVPPRAGTPLRTGLPAWESAGRACRGQRRRRAPPRPGWRLARPRPARPWRLPAGLPVAGRISPGSPCRGSPCRGSPFCDRLGTHHPALKTEPASAYPLQLYRSVPWACRSHLPSTVPHTA